MDEYSRILIEEYCSTHNSAKSKRLAKLVAGSYDLGYVITDADALFLSKCIDQANDEELREALQDLDSYLCGY